MEQKLLTMTLAERIRHSAWAVAILRVLGFAGALLLLACIGYAATDRPTGPGVHDAALATPAPDAGTEDASPPPAPSPAPAPPAETPSSSRSSHATPQTPVYVNYATIEELRRLPGVGNKRAEAIVSLRTRVGRFQRLEDLLKVKGIGRSSLKKWRPLVRFDAPADASPG